MLRIRWWFLVLALPLQGCTCGSSMAPPPPQAVPGAIRIALHADAGGGQLGNEVEAFFTSQHTLMFRAVLPAMRQGQQVRWVLSGSPANGLGRALAETIVLLPSDGAPALSFTPANDVDWPSGPYRVDLLVDGTPWGAREFLVASPTPP